jgi:hypothetical protein
MSEYQYYEFQAIDRPLTAEEREELRRHSSRARITSTSFVNEYHFGSFKGDADRWMERYFDAHLYLANWGSRVLKLRLPAGLLDAATARAFADGDRLAVRERQGRVILTFRSEDEEGDDCPEAGGRLASLVAVRDELARGDLRALYLGWLVAVQDGFVADDVLEPPVPGGLGRRSASLDALVDFLRVDEDLLEAAAEGGAPAAVADPDAAAVRRWIAGLAGGEKDRLLERLLVEPGHGLARQLLRRVREEGPGRGNAGGAEPARRTVGALRERAETMAEERRRLAAERAQAERARQEGEAARARAKHLDSLAGKEPALWRRIEELVATKKPRAYDEAVALLVDLRDLAARGDGSSFRRRVEGLRAAHASKRSFLERLDRVGPTRPCEEVPCV